MARSIRLPAEWEKQCAVMLAWPHEETDWAPHLAEIEAVYSDIAVQVTRFENLIIVCKNQHHQATIARLLDAAGAVMQSITFSAAPSNDTWIRDYGPITVIDERTPVLLNFGFNGWGGKYSSSLDCQIIKRLNDDGTFNGTRLCNIDFILEGGSIENDGEGALLTTTQCLLAPSRNPSYGKNDIEHLFRSLLGIKRVIWLEHGHIIGDDTDGHIDMLARFCDNQTIAYAVCDDTSDEHYNELQAMEIELGALRTIDDRPYRLVPLPLPAPVVNKSGHRLPASYANFLIINKAVLAPLYDDPADSIALANLANCFPEREIIGIPCRPLILQNGSLHCATMQLPAGVLSSEE